MSTLATTRAQVVPFAMAVDAATADDTWTLEQVAGIVADNLGVNADTIGRAARKVAEHRADGTIPVWARMHPAGVYGAALEVIDVRGTVGLAAQDYDPYER